MDTEFRDVKQEKAENFAVAIISLYKYLKYTKNETAISDQILRSGTSIGANIAEANFAESNSDFIHKLKIALKEAGETLFWLRVLGISNEISQAQFIE